MKNAERFKTQVSLGGRGDEREVSLEKLKASDTRSESDPDLLPVQARYTEKNSGTIEVTAALQPGVVNRKIMVRQVNMDVSGWTPRVTTRVK